MDLMCFPMLDGPHVCVCVWECIVMIFTTLTTHLYILCVPFSIVRLLFHSKNNSPLIIVGRLCCVDVLIAAHRLGMCVLCIVPHLPILYVFQAERLLYSHFMCKFPCSCTQQFDQMMHISEPIVGFIGCLVYKLLNEYVNSCLIPYMFVDYRTENPLCYTLNLHYAKSIQWRRIGHFFK